LLKHLAAAKAQREQGLRVGFFDLTTGQLHSEIIGI
jgi:hypothetical protein